MAADDRLVSGALRQAGVVRMSKYSDLVLTAKGLALMPLPKAGALPCSLLQGLCWFALADCCERDFGCLFLNWRRESRERLQSISPNFVRMRNPVDIWPSATIHGAETAYREGMEAVLMDPNVDAVVSVLLMTDETGAPPLDFIVDLARRFPDKPIYVSCSGQKKHIEAAKAFLEPKGIPTFWFAEEALEALSYAAQWPGSLERGGQGHEG